ADLETERLTGCYAVHVRAVRECDRCILQATGACPWHRCGGGIRPNKAIRIEVICLRIGVCHSLYVCVPYDIAASRRCSGPNQRDSQSAAAVIAWQDASKDRRLISASIKVENWVAI